MVAVRNPSCVKNLPPDHQNFHCSHLSPPPTPSRFPTPPFPLFPPSLSRSLPYLLIHLLFLLIFFLLICLLILLSCLLPLYYLEVLFPCLFILFSLPRTLARLLLIFFL